MFTLRVNEHCCFVRLAAQLWGMVAWRGRPACLPGLSRTITTWQEGSGIRVAHFTCTELNNTAAVIIRQLHILKYASIAYLQNK